MKPTNRFPRLKQLLALFLLTVGILTAQSARADMLNEEMFIDLDAVGDGTVTIKDHYTASDWLEWKGSIGDHPDLVVRNMKRNFAAWEFYDFSFSKDEVNRIAESKMKVRAFAQITNDGNYLLGKLQTGLRLVTNKGSEWIFAARSGDESDGKDITIHISMPSGATNVHVVNPDSSQTQVVYSMPAKVLKTSPLLILALVFGLFGAAILGLSLRLNGGSVQIPQIPQMLAVRKIIKSTALASGAKWSLVGRTPEGETLRLEITDAMFAANGNRLVLGRTAELCHVVLGTKSVSRQHAQIRKDGWEFKVADRNSSNGTAVNGQFSRQPFDEVPFKEGDTLTLGDVKLDFTKA